MSFAASCVIALPLRAQEIVPPRSAADSALNAGDLARAESLYYLAAKARPRDPSAREALGRYLGMRGAARVAVVLLEEARLFGADPARIAVQLAPLYAAIGDSRALLTLPGSPLTRTERMRAAWMAEHPESNRTDTVAATIVGSVRGDTLGRVAVRIGGRTAMAILLAQDVGITAGARLAVGARVFAPDSPIAALDLITIGTARVSNAPVTIGGPPGVVMIGMSELGPLVPTFDYSKNRLTFNRPLSTLAPIRLPLIRDRGVLRVLDRGRWVSLSDYTAGVARARQVMTIDFRAGEVRVLP
jgi:hypothetical protein